ncbi:MAG: FAD-dependent oxidoreductase [Flavobacteriales bacterium]|nr:FAD-dependent oxidoreductase [Flavobacteriales bacterium]
MSIKLSQIAILGAMALYGCSEPAKEQETSKVDYDVIVIGAGAAGMYAAKHLDANGIQVKILEAASIHGGRAQNNESFGEGFLSLGPEEVYHSPDFPIPLRDQAMTAFIDWAIEDGKDTNNRVIVGDSVYFADKFIGVLPDSGHYPIDVYRDIYLWDSTLLHPFEIGVEYYNQFHTDNRDRLPVWPYHNMNNYDDVEHMQLKNIVYMKDGKRVNAQDDPTYEEALLAWDKIAEYTGPPKSYSEILELQGIKQGDLIWTLLEDIRGAGTHATSLNRLYSQENTSKKLGKITKGGDEGYTFTQYGHNVYYIDLPYKQLLDSLYFQVLHDKDLIQYNSPVTKVDYSKNPIVVTDESGKTYTTNHVVSTVSTGVLQSEIIEFSPALPAKKVEAYNKLNMDAGMRMYLMFKEPIWEKDDIWEIYGAGYSTRCWVPAMFRREGVNDPNVLQCYIMGERADYVLQPDVDVEETVVKELDAVFGGTIASDNFVKSFYMNYKDNPYIKGIYTYRAEGVEAGTPNARETLAQPVGDKVFFGGEASNNGNNSTIFGAMETGLRCAQEIIAAKLVQR